MASTCKSDSEKTAQINAYASRCRDGTCNCSAFILKMPTRNKMFVWNGKESLKENGYSLDLYNLTGVYTFEPPKYQAPVHGQSGPNPLHIAIQKVFTQLQCVIHDYLIRREWWYNVLARDIFSGTGNKSDVLRIIFKFMKEKCENKMQSLLDKRYIPYMPLRCDDFGVPIALDTGKLLDIYLKAMFHEKNAVLYNAAGDFACWPEEHFKAVYGGGFLGTNIESLYNGGKEKMFLYNSHDAGLCKFNVDDFREKYYEYLFEGPMGLYDNYNECMLKGEFSWTLYAINGYHHQSFFIDASVSEPLVLFYKKSAPASSKAAAVATCAPPPGK